MRNCDLSPKGTWKCTAKKCIFDTSSVRKYVTGLLQCSPGVCTKARRSDFKGEK